MSEPISIRARPFDTPTGSRYWTGVVLYEGLEFDVEGVYASELEALRAASQGRSLVMRWYTPELLQKLLERANAPSPIASWRPAQ